MIHLWYKSKIEDSEIDIEHSPVLAIDRRGEYSVFGFSGEQGDEYVRCTIEQHANFLARFRNKVGLKPLSTP